MHKNSKDIVLLVHTKKLNPIKNYTEVINVNCSKCLICNNNIEIEKCNDHVCNHDLKDIVKYEIECNIEEHFAIKNYKIVCIFCDYEMGNVERLIGHVQKHKRDEEFTLIQNFGQN